MLIPSFFISKTSSGNASSDREAALLCVIHDSSQKKKAVDSLHECNFVVADDVGDTHICWLFFRNSNCSDTGFNFRTKRKDSWQGLMQFPIQATGVESNKRCLTRLVSGSTTKEIRLSTTMQFPPQGLHCRQDEERMYWSVISRLTGCLKRFASIFHYLSWFSSVPPKAEVYALVKHLFTSPKINSCCTLLLSSWKTLRAIVGNSSRV